ncbi:MAG: Lrp/AsnC family transcriptional regulator [Robiginitomaculum sp.]
MQISDKDQQVLTLLRENARMSTTDLAKILGLSRSTVQKRLERLEDTGVIEGYTVQLSAAYLDKEIKAHVSVTAQPKMLGETIEAMKHIAGVRAVYSVSGPFDMIAEVAAMSVRELDALIDSIIEIDGVERTVSSVILSTRLKR